MRSSWWANRVLVGLLAMVVGSCGVFHPDATITTYPEVDGSTSTHPLGVLLACNLLGVGYEWRTPPASERTVFPTAHKEPSLAARIEDKVRHHGTHQAYVNLVAGDADLILVARLPSEPELAAAETAGVSLDARPIALDALVFVVHASNPVSTLSIDEIRSVFGQPGRSSWAELGGPDLAIEPYQRQADSGSQELIRRLVMKNAPMIEPERAPLIYSMGGVVSTVAVRQQSISFSVYYYIINMAPNPATKLLAIDGIPPSFATIENRSYSLVSEVYAVVRTDSAPTSPAVTVRDWLLTQDGRAAIRESGYVPFMPAQTDN